VELSHISCHTSCDMNWQYLVIALMGKQRGKGIGVEIMRGMERYCLENGLHTLKLNAQIQAESFYKRIGYTTVSDTFYDANILHVTMNKQLLKSTSK